MRRRFFQVCWGYAGFLYGKLADGVDNTKNALFGYDAAPDAVNTWLDDYTQFAVSAFWGSLDVGPYVAAVYQQREFSNEVRANNGASVAGESSPDYTVQGFEFTVAYTFTNGIKLATGYEMQTIDFDDDTADVDAATVPVMVIWNINPNFDVWAEARFDAGTDDDENGGVNFDDYTGTSYAENVFSLGLRYNF